MTRRSEGLAPILLACVLMITGSAAAADQEPAVESSETAAPAEGQPAEADGPKTAFRGTVTITERPIVEGNEVDRYGSIVATVTERQIDDLHAQDLSSALRRVPGVVISRYNLIGAFGGGDGGAVFIRGHGSGRPGAEIATMTDGVPRFVGVWTHPLLDPLSVDTVDRIDVYRSAQPVLFGNMAFGAVDMVSRRWSGSGSGGRFVGSYGSHDTLVGKLEYGGRKGAVDYLVTASHRHSDGHRDNADGTVQSVSGRVGLRLSDKWDVSVLVQHTAGDVNDPGVDGAHGAPIVPNYATDSDFVLADVSHAHGRWDGHVKLYYDAADADWLQWDAAAEEGFTTVTRSENFGARFYETIAPWTGGELVLGLDYDIYGGETYEARPAGEGPRTDLHFRNTAPYVMLSHVFSGGVEVTPSVGLRYNDSRYFGSDWGGQAGLKIDFGEHAVYANYAHAFNLPGVYAAVLYGGWGRGDQWRDLEAETVDHVEVGWLAAVTDRVRLDLSVYRDEVSKAIRFVPPPPPPPLFANIGAYDVQGVEVSLQAQVNERIALFLGGTFNDAEPAEVPNLPRTTAVAGMSYSAASAWRLNVDLEWVDERYVLNPRFAPGQSHVAGHLVIDGRLGLPIRWLGLGGVNGEIFASGQNLGDELYEYRPGYPMPGRTVNVGLDVSF